jgi:hypothetical protein
MRFAILVLGFALGAIVFIGASIVIAWTGPSSAPPDGNVDAPLNVGTTDQIKNGGLGVNALAVFGNAIVSGVSRYLNFGTTVGTAGYGIRDNNGIMEFKDSGGAWQSATSTIQSFFAAGSTNAISQIKFADGTTQTTAGGGSASGVAFLVNKNGTNQAVTPGATTKLTWSTEVFDTNNNFASSRFTPTVAGEYILTASARCTDDCQVFVYKNAVAVAHIYVPGDAGDTPGGQATIILDMNGTTDYAEAYVSSQVSPVLGTTDTTYFTGTRIAP